MSFLLSNRHYALLREYAILPPYRWEPAAIPAYYCVCPHCAGSGDSSGGFYCSLCGGLGITPRDRTVTGSQGVPVSVLAQILVAQEFIRRHKEGEQCQVS